MVRYLTECHRLTVTRTGTDVGYSIGLAALYVLTARIGLTFDRVDGFASLVWLPSGVSLAALLLLGNRLWPGVFAGAVIASLLSGAPLAPALCIGFGNTAEALAGVYLLHRVRDFSATLSNVRSVVALIILAALAATMISATVGVISLVFGGIISASEIPATWRAWWIGDIVGALVITPVILVWSRKACAPWRTHLGEVAILSTAILATVAMGFFGDLPYMPSLSSRIHDANALLIVLLWATLRFGQRGAASAAFCVSGAAVFATVLGHGPLVQPGANDGVVSLQVFMAIVAATYLLLGAHVSELRLAVTAARRSEEDAALANRTKSEFLAVMSHELRTPLNAIGGYAQLLIEGIHGKLNDEQHDDVERIRSNERQLLARFEEIFGFVSAEKGELKVRLRAVDVSDALDSAAEVVREEFREYECALRRTEVEPGLAVSADAKSLERILASLLSNGAKFCGEKGVVTIGADRENDRVRMWVRDTGPGISKDEIQRVFEPFFQIERGLTRRTSGIGLGLTIARDLARRMEGEVTLASDGRGTTASLLLPRALPAESPHAPALRREASETR